MKTDKSIRIWPVALMSGMVGGALGVVIAMAGQSWLTQPSTEQLTTSDAANSLVGSRSELAFEVANLRLAQERLQTELGELRGAVSKPLGAVSAATLDRSDLPLTAPATNAGARPQRPGAVVATAESLVVAGLSSSEADSMIARLDELALSRLEADYLVRQTGGGGSADVNQARLDRRAIPQDGAAIREEFGETAYDQYLYASQQPNRVSVASVLRESAAQDVGVQTGDILRSLDGEPLYSVRDLTARVRLGAPEQSYSLVVERNGQTIETWVPGGPLGVRVSAKVVEPGS